MSNVSYWFSSRFLINKKHYKLINTTIMKNLSNISENQVSDVVTVKNNAKPLDKQNKTSKSKLKALANKEFKLEFNSLKTVCRFLNSMYNEGNKDIVAFYDAYGIKPINVGVSKISENWRIKDKEGNPARIVKNGENVKKVTITSFSAWAVLSEMAAYASNCK